MRNLKRALSLAMASVMLLGMMVVGAGAVKFEDFTDKDKVKNAEAVSILNTLGVISGKDGGAFDPTGIVTRAEMAKMICVALNGGKDPQLGTGSISYTDTVGHWAAAYIEYCTNLGIVAGKGNKIFAPNATVTGSEASKMLLVAMGHQAAIEKFTGANWEISVGVAANQKRLYAGLTLNPSEGLTRDNAAQMIFNALNCKMVSYKDNLIAGADGQLTTSHEKYNQDYTLLNNKFGAVRVEGVVINNGFSSAASSMAGKTVLNISNSEELNIALKATQNYGAFTGNTFEIATGAAEYGRTVILYVKPSASSASASKAAVISNAVMGENTVVTINSKLASGKTLENKTAKDAGLKFVDSASGDSTVTVFETNYSTAAEGFTKNYNGLNGVEVILIDNDNDGEIEYALQNTFGFGKVTKYSVKDKGSISVNGTLSFANEESKNVVGFEDIAKDNFVTVQHVSDRYYVAKAEIVEGAMTAYKADKYLTVDGTDYKFAGVFTNDADLHKPSDVDDAAHVDVKAKFYLDRLGYVVAVGDVELANAYAYVANAQMKTSVTLNGTSLEAYVVLEDGTASTYKVTKVDGVKMNNSTDVTTAVDKLVNRDMGSLCKYYVNSDNEMELTTLDKADAAGKQLETSEEAGDGFNYKKGESKLTYKTSNSKYVTAGTTFFYVMMEGTAVDKVIAYKGKDAAPSVNGDNIYSTIALDKDDANKAAAVVIRTASVATSDYLYVVEYVRSVKDALEYRAIVNGELQVITVDTANTKLSGAYEFSKTSKDYYKLSTKSAKIATDFVMLMDGKSVVLDNGAEYTLNGSSVISLLDGSDTDTKATLNKKDYVTITFNSDKVIENVYIIEAYGTDGTSVLQYNSSVITANYVTSGNTYDFGIAKGTAVAAAETAIEATKGASTAIVANSADTSTPEKVAALAKGDNVTSFSDGTAYKLVVLSEDGSRYAIYTMFYKA